MMNKREEILSAVQNVAGDIKTTPRGTAVTPQGITVDIGGINVRNNTSSRSDGPSCRVVPATAPLPLDERRRDCRRRSLLRLSGIFLTFMGIFPLYLVDVLPDAVDVVALWIGFISLIGGMISFAAMAVYEDA
jgi:hypothetical protein